MVGSTFFGRSTEKVVVIGGSCSGDVVVFGYRDDLEGNRNIEPRA